MLYLFIYKKKMSALIYVSIGIVLIILIIVVVFLMKGDKDDGIDYKKLKPLDSNTRRTSSEEEEEEEKKYVLPEIKPIQRKPNKKNTIDMTPTVDLNMRQNILKLKGTNLCVDAKMPPNIFTIRSGDPIFLYPCHGKNNQRISSSAVGHLFFKYPPVCLHASKLAANEKVRQSVCNDMASEQQYWEYDEKQRLRLSMNSNFCLSVSSPNQMSELEIQPCSDNPLQKWVIE